MSRRPGARHQPDASYQRAHEALYGRAHGREGRYRRDLLPEPSAYYVQHLTKLQERGEWAQACCPFHEDHRPSLSVNLMHGGFVCHACGARGGDVLAFHRRLKNLGFVAATKELGAWEGL
jgi:hypothetical protein